MLCYYPLVVLLQLVNKAASVCFPFPDASLLFLVMVVCIHTLFITNTGTNYLLKKCTNERKHLGFSLYAGIYLSHYSSISYAITLYLWVF